MSQSSTFSKGSEGQPTLQGLANDGVHALLVGDLGIAQGQSLDTALLLPEPIEDIGGLLVKVHAEQNERGEGNRCILLRPFFEL